MKKLLSNFTIMMLVAAMALTSCDQQQAENENEVPLKVTYVMECSRDLLDLCDVVVTYKGDDGANAVDTIKAAPTDSTETKTWTKTVGTHKIPVIIGYIRLNHQPAETGLTKRIEHVINKIIFYKKEYRIVGIQVVNKFI